MTQTQLKTATETLFQSIQAVRNDILANYIRVENGFVHKDYPRAGIIPIETMEKMFRVYGRLISFLQRSLDSLGASSG